MLLIMVLTAPTYFQEKAERRVLRISDNQKGMKGESYIVEMKPLT